MRILILIMTLCSLTSCRVETNPCSLSQEVMKDIQRLDSLIKVPELVQRDVDWMKANYHEPSLVNSETESYRFFWGDAFDTTRIVRIEKKRKRF